MCRIALLLGASFSVLAMLAMTGCAASNNGESSKAIAQSKPNAGHDHKAHGSRAKGGHMKEAEDEPAGLKELSPEDRELAKKQKICPVSEQLLGSMGKPPKVSVKDKIVFICCEGCRETLLSDPDKYLAKLKL